jgi:hypothetical protein
MVFASVWCVSKGECSDDVPTHNRRSRTGRCGSEGRTVSGSRSRATTRRLESKLASMQVILTPPEVGAAEANSPSDMPMKRMKILPTTHCETVNPRSLRDSYTTYTPNHGCWTTIRNSEREHAGDTREESNDTKRDTEYLPARWSARLSPDEHRNSQHAPRKH